MLLDIARKPFKFIVIGGWAAYLWTALHKSKDIDIALIRIKDIDYLKQKYALSKNDNLKKYGININEIDIDIYVPYYSKLAIPVEELDKYIAKVQGLTVLKPEALVITKQGAEIERGESVKGIKDRVDIMALLLFTDFNFKIYFELLKRYKLNNYYARLMSIINNFKEYEYLGLNPREFKLKKNNVLKKLK